MKEKIIVVLPAREGVSARGTQWKSQDYVIETHEAYPKENVASMFSVQTRYKCSIFRVARNYV